MTDSTSLHPPSTQPLEHAALERIVRATGRPLFEGMDPDRALGILNMIVIETSAVIPKIGSAKAGLSRYKAALLKLSEAADMLTLRAFVTREKIPSEMQKK